MKGKIFDKFRKSKPFELRDIAIYCASIFIIVALFISLLGFNKNSDISGFKITVKNELAVILYFEKGVTIEEPFIDFVTVYYEDNLYTVTVYTEDKNGFNQILFDLNDKSVWVNKSNCSDSKDCVHFPKLTDSGTIYCAPHKLKISTIKDQYKTPIVGEI